MIQIKTSPLPRETKTSIPISMVTLTSIDYARLIQFVAAKKYHTLMNKTQVNKVLFYIYGAYLASHDAPLFTDDTPKIWTYGPVFPRPNKKIVSCEKIEQSDFTKEQIEAFKADEAFLSRIVAIVGNMCNISAFSLSRWSHQEGSPWYRTLYHKDETTGKITGQEQWNTPIKQEYIKEYFANPENAIFG